MPYFSTVKKFCLKETFLGLFVVLSSMARWITLENLVAFCHPLELVSYNVYQTG